jgi:iron complex outermembrane receptor protein/vitamin B12 transporter
MFIGKGRSGRVLGALCALVLSACIPAYAGVIRGTVTDPTGATVRGATVVLLNGAQYVATAVSTADGAYQFVTGKPGRFTLLITARGFRQLDLPVFYAGSVETIERNLVLEPDWVHQSIVVTATGTPTPQQQTSATTTVLDDLDLKFRTDFVSALRLMPGTAVVQTGQMGAQTSLFMQGGDSDSVKVFLDGVDAGDLGGRFDFGPMSTTGIEKAEVFRGPDSNLYGAGAGSGVVSFTTPKGVANSPLLRLAGEVGDFSTSRESAELSGAHKKLDYYSAYSWLQTSNSIPNDEYHVGSASGNFGWQPLASTVIRGTVHYGVDATGVPNAYTFYRVADKSKESDQDLFISGAIENQTTADFHNTVRYGATRKREQLNYYGPSGDLIEYNADYGLYAYFGNPVTFTGANGYTASGRAILDYSASPSRTDLVSNRDQLVYQGDFHFTPHLVGLIGFRYEDERGSYPNSSYYAPVEHTNYDYLASVHGDFKGRLFYTLGGSLEHYSLFGTQTSPRGGVSFYALKPRKGLFNGTRISVNFADGVREPTLTDQESSLYYFLQQYGGQSTIDALHITPIGAPTTRQYAGGVEQMLLGEHLIFRANYFHNQFGRQIEYVGLNLVPELLPNLTPAQAAELESFLQNNYAYELTLNSEAYRAQGIEATLEGGIGRRIFLRGGYTYLDAVIQRSFTNDDEDLLGPLPTYDGIPVGPYSPLKGARPFRRPPHTGFIAASYAGTRWTVIANAAFASRSDDSTFLEGSDLTGGNTLLLPNRNLDFGFAKLDLGASFRLMSHLAIYGQTENLTSNQHIAPIGYPSLPFNFRAGVRVQLGKNSAL